MSTGKQPRRRPALLHALVAAAVAAAVAVTSHATTTAQQVTDELRTDPTNAGALDIGTFNPPDGYVLTELLSLSEAAGILQQSSGRIVAGGTAGFAAAPRDQLTTLVGYHPDGSIDNTFGVRGVSQVPVGLEPVPTDLLEDPQGRLLNVGGNAEGEFYVTRHTADGRLDLSYGTAGVALLDVDLNEATDVVLQDDGKLVMVGYRPIVVGELNQEIVVARLTADGQPDTTFGSGGVHIIRLLEQVLSGGLGLQSDGKIIVGGTATQRSTGDQLATLTRLDTDGSRDLTFGGADGTRLVPINGFGAAQSVAVGSDDSILYSGLGEAESGNIFGWQVGKLTADGDIDTSYGDSSGFTVVTTGPASRGQILESLLLDDDRLLVAGYTSVVGTPNTQTALGLFTADGQLDDSFGDGGVTVTELGTDSSALGLALQADGKILIAGQGGTSEFVWFVARYLGAPSTVIPIEGSRLAETRVGPGYTTVDGRQQGIGRRAAGQSTEIPVAGRADIPGDALAAILTLAAVDPAQRGYMTLHDCADPVPRASTLNYVADSVIANSTVVDLGDDGSVCVFTQRETDFVLDATAYVNADGDLTTFDPTRLLETRVGAQFTTTDGEQEGIGRRTAGQVTAVDVADRAGIPADAVAAWVNVAAVEPDGPAFVTGFPCGDLRPTASIVNARPDRAIANSALLPLGDDGTVCLYTQKPMDLVVDVVAYVLPGDDVIARNPARLVETRVGAGFRTVDDQQEGIGRRSAGQVTEVEVTGRAGVPEGAVSAILTVTAVTPDLRGFLSAYTCGGVPPQTSTVNYEAGQTIAGQVVVGLSDDGTVCIRSQRAMDLVVDVVGFTT